MMEKSSVVVVTPSATTTNRRTTRKRPRRGGQQQQRATTTNNGSSSSSLGMNGRSGIISDNNIIGGGDNVIAIEDTSSSSWGDNNNAAAGSVDNMDHHPYDDEALLESNGGGKTTMTMMGRKPQHQWQWHQSSRRRIMLSSPTLTGAPTSIIKTVMFILVMISISYSIIMAPFPDEDEIKGRGRGRGRSKSYPTTGGTAIGLLLGQYYTNSTTNNKNNLSPSSSSSSSSSVLAASAAAAYRQIEQQQQRYLEPLNLSDALVHSFSKPNTSNCSAFLHEKDIRTTLVTQCSLDRLWIMEQTCKRWKDPIVVILSLSYEEAQDKQRANKKASTRWNSINNNTITQIKTNCPQLNLIIYELSQEQSQPGAYPVNLLRNIGLNSAQTSHVLMIDIDFVPSASLDMVIKSILMRRQNLRTSVLKDNGIGLKTNMNSIGNIASSIQQQQQSSKHMIYPEEEEAFIIPAFERLLEPLPLFENETMNISSSCATEEECRQLHYQYDNDQQNTTTNSSSSSSSSNKSFLPRTFEDLSTCFRQTRLCTVFHEYRFLAGHSTTKSRTWLYGGEKRIQEMKSTNVPAKLIDCFDSIKYEPYVVIRWCPSNPSAQGNKKANEKPKPVAPYYDERFTGYGFNKVEWVQHLRISGRKFFVIPPKGFLVHNPHVDSKSREAYFTVTGNAMNNNMTDETASDDDDDEEDSDSDDDTDSRDDNTSSMLTTTGGIIGGGAGDNRTHAIKMRHLYEDFITKLRRVYQDNESTKTPLCKKRVKRRVKNKRVVRRKVVRKRKKVVGE